jgi:glyoxylase I family protein
MACIKLELFSFPEYRERGSFPEAKGLRHLAFAVKDVKRRIEWLRLKNVKTEEIRTDEFTGKNSFFSMIRMNNRLNCINYNK